jgi:hypothetical protein
MENINRSNDCHVAFKLHQRRKSLVPRNKKWGRRQKIARSNPP